MERDDWIAVGSVLGLAALFSVLHRNAVAGVGGVMSKAAVRAAAARVIARDGFDVMADMVANIAMIESAGNTQALRYEPYIPHLGRSDYSVGLMQVLTSTAGWLADIGYRRYGRSISQAMLLDPDVGLYFGAAYLDYLRTYAGMRRSDDFVVQSYNAGPGNPQSAYLAKYRAEAAR